MAERTKSVLVTGGAGFIGSHVVLALLDAGSRVVVLDDLTTGARSLVPPKATFVEGKAGDRALVGDLLNGHHIESVVHLAGSTIVPESVIDPLKYYRNNTAETIDLVATCSAGKVTHFVFSSTAAVYGLAEAAQVVETGPTNPISPYGHSKLMVERVLADAAAAGDLNFIALRYFNVAGADPLGRAGRIANEASHLIEIACEAALGLRSVVEIYGTDYETADGTCVRDFIHVSDLAQAHVAALDLLSQRKVNGPLNCGYGHGYSVSEVLAAVEGVAGRSLDIRKAARRPGDPVAIVADVGQARALLPWRPRLDDLGEIIRTQIEWLRARHAARLKVGSN